MEPSDVVRRLELVRALPMVRWCDVRAVDPGDPVAGMRLLVTPDLDNGAGGLHGSALALLVETTAYLALCGSLDVSEHAVSHALSTTLLDRASVGEHVVARASVDRRTRRIGFVSVVARVGDRLVARASVVKSVVPWTSP